ncbi:unnamed protein product [Effrenium voratum]|uniref:RING-type domain-containing protein n=1 Tax=Effrenium voratum TaxID=2562239 RepID=A0AA36MP73_9DINO|nr:unnamed protein product [Effrenium voratum]
MDGGNSMFGGFGASKLRPFTALSCGIISLGLALPLLVAVPSIRPFRKEIIVVACVLIFVGTLTRLRLERCREELRSHTEKKREVRRRCWAAMRYEDLCAEEPPEFHLMVIHQGPDGAPQREVLDVASVLESGLSLKNQTTCLCCLDDFEASQMVALLPCGHLFHEDCCLAWSSSKRRAGRTCPICRANFTVL